MLSRWRLVFKGTILIGKQQKTNTSLFYLTIVKRALDADDCGENRHNKLPES